MNTYGVLVRDEAGNNILGRTMQAGKPGIAVKRTVDEVQRRKMLPRGWQQLNISIRRVK